MSPLTLPQTEKVLNIIRHLLAQPTTVRCECGRALKVTSRIVDDNLDVHIVVEACECQGES